MPSLHRWRDRLRHLSTYDVSPEFSRKVRAVAFSPLGVLLFAAAVAGLIGLALHPRVFALAGGLLAVAAAGVCWPWLTVRGLRGTLAFDRLRGVEGGEVGATATVTNHWPWPAWGLSVREPVAGHAVRLPVVGRRSKNVCRWVFVPPLRGEYPAAVPVVGTGFPFGLWEAMRPLAVDTKLIAWPRTFPVGPIPTCDGEDVVEGNVTRSKVGSTGDVLGVRPYRRGDSPRRIHWPQSARHDRLIVCELQSNSRPVVLIVLDTDPAAHTPGADGSREWAIRVVASMAKGWLDAGAQVGVAWGGLYLPPQSGAEHIKRLMDALARIGDTGLPLADVLAEPRVKADRAGVRVVVTTDAGLTPRTGRPRPGDTRWVVLPRRGFGGSGAEGPPGPAWLTLPSPDRIPHLLRHGTAEASHGS